MLLGGRLGGWATDQPPLFAHKCCLAQAPSACWPCAPSLSGPDQIACVLCGRRGVVGPKSRPFIALHQGRAGALSPSPSFLSCFCSLERGRGKEEDIQLGDVGQAALGTSLSLPLWGLLRHQAQAPARVQHEAPQQPHHHLTLPSFSLTSPSDTHSQCHFHACVHIRSYFTRLSVLILILILIHLNFPPDCSAQPDSDQRGDPADPSHEFDTAREHSAHLLIRPPPSSPRPSHCVIVSRPLVVLPLGDTAVGEVVTVAEGAFLGIVIMLCGPETPTTPVVSSVLWQCRRRHPSQPSTHL